jgi:uncharacterized protein YxjI
MSLSSPELAYDRFLVDQVIRPIANLYRITPLAIGDTPAGPPVAYVRQRKLAVREDIRFYADEGETTELFRIAARQWLDTGGSKYDVVTAGGERLATLHHTLRSIIRTTWSVQDANEQEVARVVERSLLGAILRRAVDFVPDYGSLIPIPYNFDIRAGETVIGRMDRKFQIRDRYVLDLTGDPERRLDRRVAIALAVGLDTLQNR